MFSDTADSILNLAGLDVLQLVDVVSIVFSLHDRTHGEAVRLPSWWIHAKPRQSIHRAIADQGDARVRSSSWIRIAQHLGCRDLETVADGDSAGLRWGRRE